jgi:(4S)-4-hydroxy-5-phosphonooxypentane-2,3-dione isomerase
MAALAILVEFTLKPGFGARFQELITANAASSLREGPGCRQFDVLMPIDEPGRVVLYEIYDDDRAFDFHMSTPHYRSFAAVAEPLIDTRSVRRLHLLHPAVPTAKQQAAGRTTVT